MHHVQHMQTLTRALDTSHIPDKFARNTTTKCALTTCASFRTNASSAKSLSTQYENVKNQRRPSPFIPVGGKETDTTTPQPASTVIRTAACTYRLTKDDLYDPNLINDNNMLHITSNEVTTADQQSMGIAEQQIHTDEQSRAQSEHKFTRELLELESKRPITPPV